MLENPALRYQLQVAPRNPPYVFCGPIAADGAAVGVGRVLRCRLPWGPGESWAARVESLPLPQRLGQVMLIAFRQLHHPMDDLRIQLWSRSETNQPALWQKPV